MPDIKMASDPDTDLSLLFQGSYEISIAGTEKEILSSAANLFRQVGFLSAILMTERDNLSVYFFYDPQTGEITFGDQNHKLPNNQVASNFKTPEPVLLNKAPPTGTVLYDLVKPFYERNARTISLFPIMPGDQFIGLVIIAIQTSGSLGKKWLQPIVRLVNIMGTNITRLRLLQKAETRLTGLQRSVDLSLNILFETDLEPLYKNIYSQIRQILGSVDFLIAIYSAETNLIELPCAYEKDARISIDPFPLGEGLTSLLIKNRKPLMFVDDAENQARAYGAKVVGLPAKSWIGVPLLVGDQMIGAMIVEDVEHEHRFTEDDLDFILALSPHVAASIRNAQVVSEIQKKLKAYDEVRETAQRRSQQLLTAAEIARDVSGALQPDELLSRVVNLVKDRFGFYHASVFLINPTGDYAVLRESTGEAGRQMKETGHKLAVGSKSIVGQATATGAPLVSNDVTQDPTHLPNPLLPATRAELAIPLKVAGRILGALDVQHTISNAFSSDDISILQTLADQLSTAIVNAELFASSQRSLAQHKVLHQITTSASLAGTMEDAFASIVQGLQAIIENARIAILLSNPSSDELEIKAWKGYPEELKVSEIKFHLGQGITGCAARDRETIYLGETLKDARYLSVDQSINSELAIPLLYRDELLGVLNLESPAFNAFSESDQEVLGTLASSVAVIIANLHLVEQIRKQVERQQQLFEAASRIRRSVDIKSILETSAIEIGKALGAQRARIELNPNSNASSPARPVIGSAKESN